MQSAHAVSSLSSGKPSRRCPERPSRRSSSASTSATPSPCQPSMTRQWNQRSAVSCTICRSVARLGRDHRLGRLLADLLEDRVQALGVERGDVGGRGSAAAPRGDGAPRGARGCRRSAMASLPRAARAPASVSTQRAPRPAPSQRLKKQRRRPVWQAMPPDRSHAQQHGVGVAIEAHLDHLLDVARFSPLLPQRLARARPVRRLAASRRSAPAPRGSSRPASAPRRRPRPARWRAPARRRSRRPRRASAALTAASRCRARRGSALPAGR